MIDSKAQGLHPCFVLHRRPYSNTSLLIEFFSREKGRVPAIAKGAASQRSKVRGLLQPFRELLVMFVGRGEILTPTRIEPGDLRVALSGRLLYCGFYLNELLMRLLQRYDPHESLYCDYHKAICDLANEKNAERCLRRFELRLLYALGYGMSLDTEADTGTAIRSDQYYRYEIERGIVAQEPGNPNGARIRGNTLLALAREQDLDPQGQREARDLMRSVLSHYLGGKPLKSRELFKSAGSSRPYD